MVNCPRCTFLCEDGAAICQMCQAPISGAAALDLDLAPWVCPQCTYVNECGPEKCGACEGPRPEQPPTPVDYTSAIASIQTEVEQHDLCRSLARAIVEYVPPIVDQYTSLETLKKQLESDISVLRESRHAALLHHRSTIRRICQISHVLKPAQLEEAAARCSIMNEKALARAIPCIELANKVSSENKSLSDAVSKTISLLQAEAQRIPPSSEALLNAFRPIKECVDAAQKWLQSLPVRSEDIASLRKQLETEQVDCKHENSDTHESSEHESSDAMVEERLSKAKNDPTSQDSEMPITPRKDETGNNLIKKAISVTALEKNSRLLLVNSITHICNELAHIREVAERIEQFSSYIQSHCTDVLHKPRQPFGSKEVMLIQRFSLDGKLLEFSIDIAKKTCELNMMTLHQIPESFVSEAQSKIDAVRAHMEAVQTALSNLPPYKLEEDPWAVLPVTVKRSGLASFCSIDEYVKEKNPLSSRVSRCLLHGYEPCVLKQFNLKDSEQTEALAADVAIRSHLQESCIFVAPINAVFVSPELGHAYIESPVYEKGNAADWLNSKPDGHEVRHFIVLLLRALAALYARGICHGNLHARNIFLISFDFSPVLIDFSRARHYSNLNIDVNNSGASDTWNVAALLYSYLTDMELIPGVPLGPLPIDTPESVRELLDALISGQCSASNALDLTFCSGDIVKEMLASRQLIRLTSTGRIHQMQNFLLGLTRKSHDFLVTVERDNSILYGMITALETAVSNDLLMNFRTKYSMQSSQGIDQGGLTADLFTEFFLRVVSPSENLFESAPEEDCPPSGPSFLPNPQNFSLSFYAAIGKAMCKALIDGRVVPLMFSSAIMKFFLDIDPDLSDLYDYDRTMANSFRNMMMATISAPNSLEVQYDLPLPCNRKTYVHEKIKQFLIERRRPQLEALKTGFFTLTGLKEQCLRLAPEDLRILICGVQTLDGAMLLREVNFEDSWGDSPTPQIVRDFLEHCPELDLRRFLRLCTSLSCLPVQGLSRKITVRKVNGTERLPVGHTCFHTLDMPDYIDEETVRSKMRIVLSHIDHVGFGYA